MVRAKSPKTSSMIHNEDHEKLAQPVTFAFALNIRGPHAKARYTAAAIIASYKGTLRFLLDPPYFRSPLLPLPLFLLFTFQQSY